MCVIFIIIYLTNKFSYLSTIIMYVYIYVRTISYNNNLTLPIFNGNQVAQQSSLFSFFPQTTPYHFYSFFSSSNCLLNSKYESLIMRHTMNPLHINNSLPTTTTTWPHIFESSLWPQIELSWVKPSQAKLW